MEQVWKSGCLGRGCCGGLAAPTEDQKYESANWATLIEAMYMAVEADPEGNNRMVVMSKEAGLPHAKCYHKNTPTDGRKFLKEYGMHVMTTLPRKQSWNVTGRSLESTGCGIGASPTWAGQLRL